VRHRRSNPEAVPLKELLGRVLQKAGHSRSAEHRAVFSAWEEIVPETIQERTRPVSYRNGKLIVVVESAPLMNELFSFRQGEFLHLINHYLQKQSVMTTVQSIDFRRK
tara:strand:- start:126 stop:449 length:324 start_codon:yes stop_codon:yes gene_type:complete